MWLEYGYFHNHAWFVSNLKGWKVNNQQTDVLRNRSGTLRPPTQQNWEGIDIKQQLYNKPNPDLSEV